MGPVTDAPRTRLPYRGGKSGHCTTGAGRWIASLLPLRRGYCEPFAGMLGVLLQRPPSTTEIVNDADGLVVNWWMAVRDAPAEMAALMRNTPHAREALRLAGETLDALDPAWRPGPTPDIRLALATHTVLSQGLAKGTTGKSTRYWHAHYAPDASCVLPKVSDTEALAERLRGVQLECADGAEVVRRAGRYEGTVIYADPPYRGTQSPYGADCDFADLEDALRGVKGPCAVSGYADEWDGLGWHRSTRRVRFTRLGDSDGAVVEREQALWTNYPVEQQSLFGDTP